MDLHFRRENGTLYLYDGNKMVRGYRDLAFVVDASDDKNSVLLHYGERETAEAYAVQTTRLFASFSNLVFITVLHSESWDPAVITRFIDTAGYAWRWWKQNTGLASAAGVEQVDEPEV